MGRADRGIARELQPRLKPLGSDFHFGNGWAPEIWGKGDEVLGVCGYQEVDFVEDNPGLTLFHCHLQLHMDFGFMCLFDYV